METSVWQPSGDSVNRLRELLRDSPEPLTAKSLQTTLGLKAKAWKATVEEALRDGFAKVWSKNRYWYVGEEDAIAARIPRLLEILREAATPLAEAQIAAGIGVTPAETKIVLKKAVADGSVYKWAGSRYWHLGQQEAIAARVPRLLAVLREAAAPINEAQIAGAMGVGPAEAKQVVRKALADGAVRKWPQSRYWHQDEDQAVREFVFARLREAPLPASSEAPPFASSKTMAKVLKALLASKEIVLAYMLPGAQTAAPSSASELLAAVQKLQRGPGVPVSVQELRAAAPMAKGDFDRAALELADRQLVYLTTHDHGWALPEADREVLIHDGGKKLYVAVTLRD